jgi:hypothetical protein
MYAKWRIFVYQVATFAGVGVREGLGHRGGAKPRNYLCNTWHVPPSWCTNLLHPTVRRNYLCNRTCNTL